MATITAAGAVSAVQPKSYYVGVQSVSVTYSAAALSAGDIIKVAKIPHGAKILDFVVDANLGTGNTAVVLDLGVTDSNSAFGSCTGTARIARATKGLPYDVSVTDAATTRYTFAELEVASLTSSSATGSITVTVLFNMDGD